MKPGTWVDPFDEMSDEDFDTHLDALFSARPGSVAVSLRVAPDLLGRVKRQAACRCPLPNVHEVDPRVGGVPLGAAPRVEGACSEDQPVAA